MADFKMYVPIEKIDTEKRTVGGWATTEDIDKQNEVVDYRGSVEAFKNWQGNIREMHEPKAVGKAIEILPNDDTKKIFVKAYISKGASDTWEKIKDGTLTGFSIGGKTINKTTQIIKDVENNSTKTINRITKYKLNELSLVDNPANASCSFDLVKSIGGIPFQTSVVEDLRKILITEATDPLQQEVTDHRNKADALIKKTLDQSELEKLADEDFGIIRKYTKGDVSTKERLLPMPDKVHAVRALEILPQYNLTETEHEQVLQKAKDKLGSAYEDHYNRLQKGGENNDMDKELAKKILESLDKVNERLDDVEKAYEGAYKPIAGAKDTPKKSSDDPSLGESAPLQSGAADDVETQYAEGRYPTKSSEPEKFDEDGTEDIWKVAIEKGIASTLGRLGAKYGPKAKGLLEAGKARFKDVKLPKAPKIPTKEVTLRVPDIKAPNVAPVVEAGKARLKETAGKVGEFGSKLGRKGKAAVEAFKTKKFADFTNEDMYNEVDYVYDVANDIGKMSDEEYDDFVKNLDDEQYQELEYVLDVMDQADDFVQKAANPATSNLETQEEVAAPVKKDGDDSRGDKYPGKHVATTDTKTQPEEGAYPAKGPIKLDAEGNEITKSENGFENKVLTGLDSLSKRVEHIERQPKPRKFKLEKGLDSSTTEAEELDNLQKQVTKWNQSGKELTPEQQKTKEDLVNKMIDSKFGKKL